MDGIKSRDVHHTNKTATTTMTVMMVEAATDDSTEASYNIHLKVRFEEETQRNGDRVSEKKTTRMLYMYTACTDKLIAHSCYAISR